MPTVVLADGGDQFWLVQGDEYVHELLIDRLPPDVTVEFVLCASPADALAMWYERSPAAQAGAQPWVIHPGIIDRIRSPLGLAPRGVRFTPWSAMLDKAAQTDLAAAAAWLGDNPGARLLLRQFMPDVPVPGQADLQRLRGQLVQGALVRAGAPAGAVVEEMATAATEADAERMEIVTQAAGSWA